MSFGKKLANYRSRAGLTQEALARRANIHTHHVSDMERGKRKPLAETLARIRDALNLSLEETVDLLEETKQPAEVGR